MQNDLSSNLLPDCIDNHGQKPQKKSARKAARAAQRAAQTPPSFFEKLGHDMADGLVRDSLPTESLNLVDRITYAKTTTSTTITANSRTIFTEETLLVAEYGSIMASDPPSEDLEESVVPSKNVRTTFDLGDFAALSALEELISQHGRVSHMGILDSSYTFFITKDRTAALYYKVTDKIAVVGGDPLCPPNLFPHVLSEFAAFRKNSGLGIAFLGASSEFAVYARQENWVTMCFGNERVLNPMTNPVLLGQSGKSITTRNKHLLNPNKDNITVEVYTPRNGKNLTLQRQLVSVYDAWRSHRNASGITQAYITVYDPFALPDLMTYVYTKDTTGTPNGFAALRMLGANQGYHLDPCVALPSSPKGITDLLTYASMALLKIAQISYLSLGYEPLETLGEITGMPKVLARASRKVHRRVFGGLNVGGKKGYYDKWRTDERLESKLFLIFPGNGGKTGSAGMPSLRQTRAVVHVANISLRKTLLSGPRKRVVEVKGEEAAEEKKTEEVNAGNVSLKKKKLLGRSSEKKEEEETRKEKKSPSILI